VCTTTETVAGGRVGGGAMRAKMAIDNLISSASNSKLEEGDLKNTSGVFDSSNTMHSYSLLGAALNL